MTAPQKQGGSAPKPGKAEQESISPDAVIAYNLRDLPSVRAVRVQISNEIVHLLSDQLYQSPLKAIEELVVNSYDANATVCRLYVPANTVIKTPGSNFMVIFDDGRGMTPSELEDLWHIGNSKKRENESTDPRARKQIGKFGIGKLATSTVGSQLTYISRSAQGIFTATLDFGQFSSGFQAAPTPVTVAIREITDWKSFSKDAAIKNLIEKCKIPASELDAPHWTLALIERLRPKASEITIGRLKWVLATAMPMGSSFALYLNGEPVTSSKDNYQDVVKFKVADLPKERIDALNEKTGDDFKKSGDFICSKTLKAGVSGTVRVTDRALIGKSDDLLRSHGFFVRVRGRLINEEEPFFGMTHLHHGTETRFNAQIFADDLDDVITAPRETVGRSQIKTVFEALLQEIFLEARQRYDAAIDDAEREQKRKKEHQREFVSAALVERPIASALARRGNWAGADADDDWFYTVVPEADKLNEVVEKLYTAPRLRFSYKYAGSGRTSRLVQFDPANATFTINSDHPFAAANSEDERVRMLLEDVVTAEALLETQLRIYGVPPQIIGEVLEQRNKLLSSLALDHPYSPAAIAQSLIDASADEHDLEIALVAAARALGFVAKHLSGAGEPDGVARFAAYPGEPKLLTLEAKSSATTPSLSAIDFAGLHEHRLGKKADGVLLVAPSYPGVSDEDAAAANRAEALKISCWTIEQLARVVKNAEARHFNAETIIGIVQRAFKPIEVAAAVEDLFREPGWDQQTLAAAIIDSLEGIAQVLPDMNRTVEAIAPTIARDERFEGISKEDIVKASSALAASSQGALIFDGSSYTLLTSFEELRRRTTAAGMPPLRSGPFKRRAESH